MNHLCSFQGPMYQVFTTDELTTIALWILAMDKSPASDMVSLMLAKRGIGQKAHKSSLQLDGRHRRVGQHQYALCQPCPLHAGSEAIWLL